MFNNILECTKTFLWVTNHYKLLKWEKLMLYTLRGDIEEL